MESIVASVLVLAVTSINASFGTISPRQVAIEAQPVQEIAASEEKIELIKPLKSDCEPVKVVRNYTNYHYGIDYVSDVTLSGNTCIVTAAADGEVTYADWASGGEGFMVRIKHNNTFTTEYFHGDGKFYVKVGDRVAAGQDIMNMGASGNATGSHLHFVLKQNDVMIDPIGFVM